MSFPFHKMIKSFKTTMDKDGNSPFLKIFNNQ